MNVPQPAGLIVVATLVVVLVVVVLVVRRRETRGPRLGTDDRASRLELDTTGAIALEPPAGIPPGELGALVLPAARYQQVTATLLDLAARGHLTLRLWSAPLDDGDPAWWTLRMRPGRDPLRPHEQVLLEECGVTVGPQRFPCLTDLSVARVARPLHAAAERHRALFRAPGTAAPGYYGP